MKISKELLCSLSILSLLFCSSCSLTYEYIELDKIVAEILDEPISIIEKI